MAHWGKTLVKWAAAELPSVITELGNQGPEKVFDVLAERYREWLKINGPRLGVAVETADTEPPPPPSEEPPPEDPKPTKRRSRSRGGE